MPFTPLHFGPGLLLKSLAPARFSFTTYAAAQVVIDVESGYYLLTRQTPVHRTLHTFLVGGLVGAAAGIAVGWVGRRLFRRTAASDRPLMAAELARGPALLGGLLGGLAHALLDGIMHLDMHPFRPFFDTNPLFHLLRYSGLEAVCILTGGAGILLLSRPRLWQRVPHP